MQNKIIYITIGVIMGAVILSFTNLGSIYLFDVDEAVFAQSSREMLESGDWITPTYNGIVRYDKPIFIYWVMALSYKLFGVNEFAARLPSLIAGLSLAIGLFVFVKRLLDEETALYALLSLVFSAYFFVYSRAAVTDMTLTLFITMSLFCFFSGFEIRHRAGFHLFSALAFLTKGLIGIVFPFGIAMSYTLLNKDWGRLRVIFSPLGISLFLLTALPWYIIQYSINGMEFIEQFFLKHHFRRYTDVISGHKGPFYYYLIALIAGLSPWILFLFNGLRTAIRERKGLLGFAFIWLLFVVAFFSLSTTKLPNYILPAIPPAVILIGYSMKESPDRPYRIAIGLLAFAMAVFMLLAPSIAKRYEIYDLQWVYWIAVINLITILIAFMPARFFHSRIYRQSAFAVCMFSLLMIIALKGLPIASERLQGSLHSFSLYARDNLKEAQRVFVYKINQPSIVFYSGRRVIRAGSIQEAEALLADPLITLMITKTRFQSEAIQMGFKIIESRSDYALLKR